MDLTRAELRFGLSDPRGLGANPRVTVAGRPLRLQPGGGGGSGFFAWIDATALAGRPLLVDYQYGFRGNRSLGLPPQAGETRRRLRSPRPHPSFQGSFLPATRQVGAEGFDAVYRVGNLALGESLVSTMRPRHRGAAAAGGPHWRRLRPAAARDDDRHRTTGRPGGARHLAQVDLVQPVDLYSRVNRSVKYGFLFIGFTFLAFRCST